jgi:hypothetical protein
MINVGDKVSWADVTFRTSGAITFKTRYGIVVDAKGQIVTIKYRGRRIRVPIEDVRLSGQTTAITEMIQNM